MGNRVPSFQKDIANSATGVSIHMCFPVKALQVQVQQIYLEAIKIMMSLKIKENNYANILLRENAAMEINAKIPMNFPAVSIQVINEMISINHLEWHRLRHLSGVEDSTQRLPRRPLEVVDSTHHQLRRHSVAEDSTQHRLLHRLDRLQLRHRSGVGDSTRQLLRHLSEVGDSTRQRLLRRLVTLVDGDWKIIFL